MKLEDRGFLRYWFPDTGAARLRQGFTKPTLRFIDTIHARENRQKADKARTKLLQKWTACAKVDYLICRENLSQNMVVGVDIGVGKYRKRSLVIRTHLTRFFLLSALGNNQDKDYSRHAACQQTDIQAKLVVVAGIRRLGVIPVYRTLLRRFRRPLRLAFP